MKKIIKNGSFSVDILLIISIIFNLLNKSPYLKLSLRNITGNELYDTIIVLVTFFILGNIFGYIDEIYKKIDNLLIATLIHYVLVVILMSIIGNLFSWYENFFIGALFINIIYIIIWIVEYISTKREVDRINKKIKKG